MPREHVFSLDPEKELDPNKLTKKLKQTNILFICHSISLDDLPKKYNMKNVHQKKKKNTNVNPSLKCF